MRIVLLSGGSGKRLWPLSNEIRSKVFLKLLGNGDGGKESMIQRICRQLDAVGLLSSTCIVTHKSQAEITQAYVGSDIPIISEPFKRGTFQAIALAVRYFHTVQNADPDECICVLPADSYAESDFYQMLHKFPEVLARSQANLALLGTKPDHPSDQFGYIVPHVRESSDYFEVARFVEKPSEKDAAELIRNHALWNCGVFAFSLSFMLSLLKEKTLHIDFEDSLRQYEQYPELSFDQEVAEKTNRIVVMPYHGSWKDLGSWSALTNLMEQHVIGLGQVSKESVNTHMVNELPLPIQVIDVSDVIVAASPDGILVANKNKSNQIKGKLTRNPIEPRYEELRWGTSCVLDAITVEEGQVALTKKLTVFPGKEMLQLSVQPGIKKILIVISGAGEIIGDGNVQSMKAGDILTIPYNMKLSVNASLPLQMIEIEFRK